MQQAQFFQQLKKEVLEHFQTLHPSWDGDLASFRNKEIATLQALIQEKVGERISEKWFYTHLKGSSAGKLPREDMLDVLARFVGAGNWQAYIKGKQHTRQRSRTWLIVTGLLLTAGVAAGMTFWPDNNYEYRLCFIDSDTQKAIEDQELICYLLSPEESPQLLEVDDSACIDLQTKNKAVSLVIQAPYYRTDTIHRILKTKKTEEQYALQTDDYALMIHYFAANRVTDWQRRRTQLQEMFATNARIIQVAQDQKTGMEIYNRTEFINKLTMPIPSLQQLRVLSTEYNDQGKIEGLRFLQTQNQ